MTNYILFHSSLGLHFDCTGLHKTELTIISIKKMHTVDSTCSHAVFCFCSTGCVKHWQRNPLQIQKGTERGTTKILVALHLL